MPNAVCRCRVAQHSKVAEAAGRVEDGVCTALTHFGRAISGCYTGQETLSKLHLVGGPKQELWGVQLSGPAQPGEAVMYAGARRVLLALHALHGQDFHY